MRKHNKYLEISIVAGIIVTLAFIFKPKIILDLLDTNLFSETSYQNSPSSQYKVDQKFSEIENKLEIYRTKPPTEKPQDPKSVNAMASFINVIENGDPKTIQKEQEKEANCQKYRMVNGYKKCIPDYY